MNILAIDYGKKKIGLAIADVDLKIALPAGQISGSDNRIKREKIIEIIKNKNIKKIIVGLPLGLNGEENENTKSVREFMEKLQELNPIEVIFIDERFTSREADRLGVGGVSRDEKAAMLILESWLGKSRGTK